MSPNDVAMTANAALMFDYAGDSQESLNLIKKFRQLIEEGHGVSDEVLCLLLYILILVFENNFFRC